jgi:hypothetical protein
MNPYRKSDGWTTKHRPLIIWLILIYSESVLRVELKYKIWAPVTLPSGSYAHFLNNFSHWLYIVKFQSGLIPKFFYRFLLRITWETIILKPKNSSNRNFRDIHHWISQIWGSYNKIRRNVISKDSLKLITYNNLPMISI